MPGWFEAFLRRRRERREHDVAFDAVIRQHPVLGQRCSLCGKPRYVPPCDECNIDHDLGLFANRAPRP